MMDQTPRAFYEKIIVSRSEKESHRFGFLLGQQIHGPLVVALTGELGAGKTRLAQGIARGLGVPETYYVTSPSYSLVNEYPGRLGLYHIDLYRLKDSAELEEIGLEEILTSDHVSVIEWAERLGPALPSKRLDITIEIVNDELRHFHLKAYEKEAEKLIEELIYGICCTKVRGHFRQRSGTNSKCC